MEVLLPFLDESCWIKFRISLKELATWMPLPRFEFSPGLIIHMFASVCYSNCLYARVNLIYSGSLLWGDFTLKVRGIATSNGLIPIAW